MPHDVDRKWPPDLAQAVGMLIVTASAVDAQVGLQIIRMISPMHFVSWHAWPIVSGMEFKVKLAMLRSLASYHDKATCDYVVECCDELQIYYQKRNQIAHAVANGQRRRDGCYSFMTMVPDTKKGGMRPPTWVSPAQIEEWGRQLLLWSNELEQTLCDLGYPTEGPTEADAGVPLSEGEKEVRRTKSRMPRTTRKQPRPRVEK